MSEEMLIALLELFEAKIDEKLARHSGDGGLGETIIFSRMKQEFIDVFIFGDPPST